MATDIKKKEEKKVDWSKESGYCQVDENGRWNPIGKIPPGEKKKCKCND